MSGRILVLTFYYAPDLCAGSFRATPFVAALLERAAPTACIDVITTLPNRYRTFEREAAARETADRLEIHRTTGNRRRKVNRDENWLKTGFVTTVAQRGTSISTRRSRDRRSAANTASTSVIRSSGQDENVDPDGLPSFQLNMPLPSGSNEPESQHKLTMRHPSCSRRTSAS